MGKNYLFLTGLLLSFPFILAARAYQSVPPTGWLIDSDVSLVTEDVVKTKAEYLAANFNSLRYVILDSDWYIQESENTEDQSAQYWLDEYGRYVPDPLRFPSSSNRQGFKPLADYIHRLGFKFGITIKRGVPRKAVDWELPVKNAGGVTADNIYTASMQFDPQADNYTILAAKPGGQEYYNSIMDLYASWGVDFIRVEDVLQPYHQIEIEMLRKAIDQTGRAMFLSLAGGETPSEKTDHAAVFADMWSAADTSVYGACQDLSCFITAYEKAYRSQSSWADLGIVNMDGVEEANSEETQMAFILFSAFYKLPLIFKGELPSSSEPVYSLLKNKGFWEIYDRSVKATVLSNQNGLLVLTSADTKEKEIYLILFNMDGANGKTFNLCPETFGLKRKYSISDVLSGEEAVKVKGCVDQNLDSKTLFKLLKLKRR